MQSKNIMRLSTLPWGTLLLLLSFYALQCSGWHVSAFQGLAAPRRKLTRLDNVRQAISSKPPRIEGEPTAKKERVGATHGILCFGKG